MNTKKITYWTTTVIVALALLSGGPFELIRPPALMAGMARLGYPPYFVTILGAWKILGGIVLLAPRLPRLKEWAYAGAFFDFTGAAISHAVVGETAHIFPPVALAILLLLSWAFRPPSRMLAPMPRIQRSDG
jgi:uncharacterized membrane protein YphA (DoxX/SURF4 family)